MNKPIRNPTTGAALTDAAPAPTPPRRGRDLTIDTLRGIAIILMVGGHVIGADTTEGLQVADDSAWRTGYLLLADLRIPLFTALSGFVYGLRPLLGTSQLRTFARGKAKRLLLPLITVATIFTIAISVVPGTNSAAAPDRWWLVYFYGVWHFWFLQAVFILLLGIGLTNALGGLRHPRSTITTIAATAVLSVTVTVPFPYNVFSINGAIRLAPFFLLGYALCRFGSDMHGHSRHLLLGLTGILFLARSAQILTGTDLPAFLDAPLGLALGLVGITTLIVYRANLSWRPLAVLGYFSYAIYLLHVFGTAPTRIALNQLGLVADVPVFALCLVAGLALPILFEITASRAAWVSWAFLGQKPYRGIPPAPRADTR